ncbi:hypothetical protein SAMN04487970_100738 [Paenibacillus tianmuensis]|uniref:Uncharacterized protein n=2 Tax=Paenibacillus tianmuensis TaxID=624147 RepID=A0A1G4QHB5_9BACL|nr:hypothetical protein SAMN04487970_100738 [Paenibacillus tianmuensis]
MSSNKTSNLKLHNWAGSDQVLRSEFNENFEKIDAFASELMAMGSVPVQLKYGMQVVKVEHTRMLENVSMKGRTLVNLLGRDGNCEDASRWAPYTGAVLSLDHVKKASGSNSIQFKIASDQASAGITKLCAVSAGKYYIAFADIANTDIQSGAVLKFGTEQTVGYTGTSFTTKWVKLAPSESGQQSLYVFGSGMPNQIANVDNVRLYEVSAEDYAIIDTMTPEEVATKWSYVDDIKSVYSPYIIKYGENLLPPFTEWNVIAGNGGTPKMDIDDPFSASLIADLSGQAIYVDIPATPNIAYTLSLPSLPANGFIGFNSFDANMQFVSAYGGYTSKLSKTIITEPNVRYLKVIFGNNTYGAGTYKFVKPVLSLGSTAKPFKSRNDDHLFFPNVNLASNVDGTVYDMLYQRDGKYWKQARFCTMELNGNLDWSYANFFTGFKEVKVPIPEAITNAATIVKHDGKPLKVKPDGIAPAGGDEFTLTTKSNQLFISISNADSGWGDSYNPSQEDIKAYFNGWRMYQEGTSAATGIYTSGRKWWARRNGTGFDSATAEMAPAAYGFINGPTAYKLQYQLAEPTVEELTAEGGLTFHEELNQVEVGNGMIVREHHNVVTIGGISYMLTGAGQKFRADRAFAVYKNGVNAGWSLKRRAAFDVNYGWGYAQTLSSNVDPSATYTVTYRALDQYALTCNVQSIQGEYAGNLKSVVDTLATNQADMAAQITELQGGTDKLESVLPLSAMSRQSIINGGFDIAQRGTSVVQNGNHGPENAYGYGLDRWVGQVYAGRGVIGTTSFTMSQQPFALGQTAVPGNPKYFGRLSVTSIGTKGTSRAFMRMAQFVESVFTFAGQKCTASFWAKASDNRSIAVSLFQYFGHGSPSSGVSCPGGKTINLTKSWQFFSVTFDVPSIAGKVLGENKNDNLGLYFIPYKQDNEVISIPSGEVGTYATGDFDFAQVQLCAGDVALPFQPRTFAEELTLCQRYFCKTFPYSTPPANNAGRGGALGVRLAATTEPIICWQYPVPMRISPSFVLYSPQGGTTGQWRNDYNSTSSANAMPFSGSEKSAGIGNSEFSLPAGYYEIHAVADAEL